MDIHKDIIDLNEPVPEESLYVLTFQELVLLVQPISNVLNPDLFNVCVCRLQGEAFS